MTKKTIFGFSLLFLFAFTFGFAFTLASSAQASVNCCVYDWCPGHEGYMISRMGHEVGGECVFTNTPPCDYTYLCE